MSPLEPSEPHVVIPGRGIKCSQFIREWWDGRREKGAEQNAERCGVRGNDAEDDGNERKAD